MFAKMVCRDFIGNIDLSIFSRLWKSSDRRGLMVKYFIVLDLVIEGFNNLLKTVYNLKVAI